MTRAYALLAGDPSARPSSVGTLSRPFDLPLHVAAGRFALAFLFVVIPLFNPALYRAADERVYLGLPIALAALALGLVELRRGGYVWVALTLALAVAYVLEVGVLRGDLALGILGNAYRPLHAVLVFCACALVLRKADRTLWIRLFLLGGLVGCTLAVLHALVPAIDPFGPSRPDDLPVESKFLTSRREEGAFVYPGNFGPYAAFVALVGLVMLERTRARPISPNLYTAAIVAGTAGIGVSGSRAAALGLFVGVVTVLVRTRRLVLPAVAVLLAVLTALAAAATAAGRIREIVESRILQADFSFSLRVESWEIALDRFRENPLFGGGVFPNTIDGTLFYLLGVGGIVGILLAAAMYWFSVLRPLRRRDWTSLPIVLAVAAIGITQDVLGTPIMSWAIGASIFLVARPAAVYGEPDEVEPAEADRRRAHARAPEPQEVAS